MADYFLENSRLLWEGYDFSANWREMSLTMAKDGLDNTTFTAEAHSTKPGFASCSLTAAGFAEHSATSNEGIANADWGTLDKVLTVCPVDVTEGSVTYSTKGAQFDYDLGGPVGEMQPLAIAAHSSGTPVIRGTLMASGAVTANGNGTARQLGAVSATQYLYGVLHVTAVSGTDTPTVTVKIYSDDNSGMTSATERIAFTAKTAIGVQWATPVAGAITDDWWRVDYTVTGTDPSLTIYCTVAIQ